MNGTSHTELLSKERESECRVGRVGERQIREKAREGVVRQRKHLGDGEMTALNLNRCLFYLPLPPLCMN